ncbi:MAG: hypothetical protein MUF43_09780 [Flavobacterium sp.]|jgi:hypothetical protein|nr:hypothetical protein [Flavobacterium sp.]
MEKITIDEIKKALLRSGYLLENRVLNTFIDNFFYSESNHRYIIDESEGRFREIDVLSTRKLASNSVNETNITLFVNFYIECLNNPVPLALFHSYGDREEPSTDWSYDFINGSPEFLEFCTLQFPRIISARQNEIISSNPARQYCGFAAKKDRNVNEKWMANHPDDFHQTLSKLSHFVRIKKADTKEQWEEIQPELTRLEIFIPMIVLQGDMIEIIDKKELELNIIDYYRLKAPYEKGYNKSLSIDIVTEKYLQAYLDLKLNGLTKMFNDLQLLIYSNFK